MDSSRKTTVALHRKSEQTGARHSPRAVLNWHSTSLRAACFAAKLAIITQLTSTTADAQELEPEARQHAIEFATFGDALYRAGDYAAALEQFTHASERVTAPTLMLRQAECLEKLGRLVESVAMYRKAAAYPLHENATEPFRVAVESAKAQLSVTQTHLAHLDLIVQAPEPDRVLVTLNEFPVSAPQRQEALELDPGQYRVKAVAGDSAVSEAVTLEQGSRRQLILRLFPAPVATQAPTPKPRVTNGSAPSKRVNTSLQSTLGWVSVGVGTASVLAGVATGIEVFHLKHDLDKQGCSETRCGPSLRDDVLKYNSLRTVSSLAFAVGGVGLAVGGALFYFTPHAERSANARVAVLVGAGSAGIAGSF